MRPAPQPCACSVRRLRLCDWTRASALTQPCSCLPRLFSLRNEAQAFINASFLVCQSTEYSHSQFTQSESQETLSTERDLKGPSHA